jgi:hypothetical protein
MQYKKHLWQARNLPAEDMKMELSDTCKRYKNREKFWLLALQGALGQR